jgi:hypothetical protein
MRQPQKIIAVALACCLYHLSLVTSLIAATTFTPASIQQRIEELGVGAKVGVKLAGGQKLRGLIEAIDDHGFGPERKLSETGKLLQTRDLGSREHPTAAARPRWPFDPVVV